MNILQGLRSKHTFCVTLNNDSIASDQVLRRIEYEHPVFTTARSQAQNRHADLLTANRTSFCGAYWRNGFHEDGVVSAMRVVEALNRNEQQSMTSVVGETVQYYCFDEAEKLEVVVAEVNNTPWGEQHHYVLDASDSQGRSVKAWARKMLHVSPFMEMDFNYQFRMTIPAESLVVHIENHSRSQSQPAFDATLSLRQRPLDGRQLAKVLIRYPLMTGQIFARIYFEAFRLWWQRVSFVPHPDKLENAAGSLRRTHPTRSGSGK